VNETPITESPEFKRSVVLARYGLATDLNPGDVAPGDVAYERAQRAFRELGEI
jgi:hypothetical protein